MMKHFLSSAVIVALLGLGGAGMRLFSNDTPEENTTMVEEAFDDPAGGLQPDRLGGTPGRSVRTRSGLRMVRRSQ